jgi:hypothetical protein
VLGRPLSHVLEVARQLYRRHEAVLVEHHLGLGLEAPRVGVGLARLAGPDLRAVLVHLARHAHDRAERLHPGHVQHDPVARRNLLCHPAPALLGADHAEAVLSGGAEVV